MFRKKSVWLYLLPGLVGLLAFYLVPFVWGIWFSLTDGTIDNRFVGFDNYLRVWQNEVFQLGLKNTIELSLLCAPGDFRAFLSAGGHAAQAHRRQHLLPKRPAHALSDALGCHADHLAHSL